MRRWMACSLTVLVAAAVINAALVFSFPWLVMRVAHRKISERAGGVNVVVHNPPTTAEHNPIVNSSPDLLYSACAFDLAKGPVRFRARVPATYWSISGYDAETNNFFSVNNEGARAGSLDLVLAGPGSTAPDAGTARVVVSPSMRGVVLFRTLVPMADKMGELVRVQREAVCTPMTPPLSTSAGSVHRP